jgi:stearoyl-CoA desaturase (delta-9 desaturase)
MSFHWKRFKKSRFYLLRYFIISFLVLSATVLLQYQFINKELYTNFVFDYRGLYLLPIGLIIGVKVPVLIHNCVHGNLKLKPLNIILGEIAGVYVLLGLAAFELNHRMHHVHSDSDMDPHNPHNKNFFRFFFANNFGGTEPVLKKYLQFYGDTKINRALFGATALIHFAAVPLRAMIWLFLLGPSLFITFFIPSYLFHMFVFAHINYYTHETFEDGTAKVYNLNDNIYYKLVNYFGSGVYYHKNHHKNPNFYNPQIGNSHSWLFK